jgi:hypothetical protein
MTNPTVSPLPTERRRFAIVRDGVQDAKRWTFTAGITPVMSALQYYCEVQGCDILDCRIVWGV